MVIDRRDDPAWIVDKILLYRELSGALNKMSVRDRTILELRYGLTGAEPVTYDGIAKHLHLSLGRLRQIERRALSRLRKLVKQVGLTSRSI